MLFFNIFILLCVFCLFFNYNAQISTKKRDLKMKIGVGVWRYFFATIKKK